jgi:hypothetical protein
MTELFTYFREGVDHLLDLNGLDHLYFIISFTLPFRGQDWRKLLLLVTAFTFGHSITLVLATLKLITIDSSLVEYLIPLSILASCLLNVFRINEASPRTTGLTFVILLAFGLLHGLGFASFLQAMLFEGDGVFWPLLGFNLGVEAGQLIIVAAVLLLLAVTEWWMKKTFWLRHGINVVVVLLVLRMMLVP